MGGRWQPRESPCLPAFLGACRFSLRLLENAQGGNGSAIMLLRVPQGSVLPEKVEHLPKNLRKKTKLRLEGVRLFALTFTQFIKFAHSVTPNGSVEDRRLLGVAFLRTVHWLGPAVRVPVRRCRY